MTEEELNAEHLERLRESHAQYMKDSADSIARRDGIREIGIREVEALERIATAFERIAAKLEAVE